MWLREAIEDEQHQADMAYVSIAGLVLALIGSALFLCTMSAVSYSRCVQIMEVGAKENVIKAFVPCPYDPNPLGIAIAACIAAFGSPIGALAGYMVATRRQPRAPPIVAGADTVNINQPTAPVMHSESPLKPKPKGKR